MERLSTTTTPRLAEPTHRMSGLVTILPTEGSTHRTMVAATRRAVVTTETITTNIKTTIPPNAFTAITRIMVEATITGAVRTDPTVDE